MLEHLGKAWPDEGPYGAGACIRAPSICQRHSSIGLTEKQPLINDEVAAAELVKEAARRAGYTVEAYHGTKSFGFTKINTSKSDDGISFFVTSDLNTAQTYSSKDTVKEIRDKSNSEPDRADLVLE